MSKIENVIAWGVQNPDTLVMRAAAVAALCLAAIMVIWR